MIEPRRTEEEVEAMRALQSLKGRMKKKEISHNLAAFVGMAVAVAEDHVLLELHLQREADQWHGA